MLLDVVMYSMALICAVMSGLIVMLIIWITYLIMTHD